MRTLGEYVVHLIVSAATAVLVFLVVSAFADDPVPALLAVIWFAGYWGVWFLVVDWDGPSGAGGGSSSGGVFDSLF